jgi:hypothetical protein
LQVLRFSTYLEGAILKDTLVLKHIINKTPLRKHLKNSRKGYFMHLKMAKTYINHQQLVSHGGEPANHQLSKGAEHTAKNLFPNAGLVRNGSGT